MIARRRTSGASPGTSSSSAAAPPASASPWMRPAAATTSLLLEQHDFGKGTSSRSTKLVHGGVRYLEQGNIALVMEALKERGLLRQNAPHLVARPRLRRAQLRLVGSAVLRPRPEDLQPARRQIRLRLVARSSRATRRWRDCRRSRPRPSRRRGLLRRPVRRRAAADQPRRDRGRAGRDAVNYARSSRSRKDARRLHRRRRRARDQETGQQWTIAARWSINATGAFSDCGAPAGRSRRAGRMIAPSQGIHLVFDRSFLPADTAIMVPHTRDGRVMFAIPWHGHTLVGTTDTPIARTDARTAAARRQEIDFILETAGRYLAQAADARRRAERVRRHPAAGQEPATARTRRRCRATTRSTSMRPGCSRSTGGKWTTYRNMAEDASIRPPTSRGSPAALRDAHPQRALNPFQ